LPLFYCTQNNVAAGTAAWGETPRPILHDSLAQNGIKHSCPSRTTRRRCECSEDQRCYEGMISLQKLFLSLSLSLSSSLSHTIVSSLLKTHSNARQLKFCLSAVFEGKAYRCVTESCFKTGGNSIFERLSLITDIGRKGVCGMDCFL
jgi:hypothetical protein